MKPMIGKVLEQLKSSSDGYVSGESLSEKLGVTRTAIWKYIKEIRGLGYEVEASTNKGYKRFVPENLINEYELSEGLDTELIGKNIIYYNSVDSTNNVAKNLAQEGCASGTVVVAATQTGGKGRLGRMWFSAQDKGIWMSIVLKPSITLQDIQLITIGASIAVARSISDIAGFDVKIKWPNDIILNSRKVCGILTEMSLEEENVNYIVVGIGVNILQEMDDFPEDIKALATSLKIEAKDADVHIPSRCSLVKKILFEMEKIYSKIEKGLSEEVISEWRQFSVTLGKRIRFAIKDQQYEGTAVDIENDGKLVVKCDDNITRKVLSGEIQIRGILGCN